MTSDKTRALDKALVDVGYHLIDQFLSEEAYRGLQTYIQTLVKSTTLRAAKVGQSLQAKHHPRIRTDHIHWLDEINPPEPTHAFFDAINTLKQYLNQQLYLGLHQFEAHIALYSPGQYYKKHIDQFVGNQDRRISCVYYLNDHWSPEHGGELSIYNQEEQRIAHILPEGNRLVCFNSTLLHEVHPTHQSRYSITGWLKSRPLDIYSF